MSGFVRLAGGTGMTGIEGVTVPPDQWGVFFQGEFAHRHYLPAALK
jgi:hypothetical protein